MANKPVKTFRIGLVSASVFENKSDDRTFHTCVAQRAYKDGDDWKHTNSLSADDLLNAAECLKQANAWIMAQ